MGPHRDYDPTLYFEAYDRSLVPLKSFKKVVRYESYYDHQVTRKKAKMFGTIKKVIFNDPATIILWADGTKTVVKCAKDDKFDPEKGFAMAIAKKAMGNDGWYYDIFKAYLPKEVDEK